MTDLIERLRCFQTLEIEAREICDEAADEIERLQAQIDAAVKAACETQPSWEWRCWSIMNALGQDFAKPATRYGEEQARIEALEQRNAKLEKVREAASEIIRDFDHLNLPAWCPNLRKALADTESSDEQDD